MKWTSAFFLIVSNLLFLNLSHADTPSGILNLDDGLSVFVECSFRATQKISCNEFIQAFFSTNDNILRANNSSAAIVSLNLTDEAVDSQLVNYHFSWSLAKVTNHSDFATTGKLNQSTSDPVFILNSLVKGASDTIKYLVDFIKEHGGNDDQDSSRREGIYDRLGKSPLYISLGGNGNYKTNGSAPYNNTSSDLTLFGSIGYIQDRYKIRTGGYFGRAKSTVPTESGYLNSQTKVLAIDGMFVYSMSQNRRWNVAVINSESVDKNSNINLNSNTQLGFEWLLVPFRTTENKEVAFRVGVGQNLLKLGEANTLGNISENYMNAFAKIYFFWVLKDSKITLRANAGINQNLQRSGYESYNLGGSVNYQVSKSVILKLDGNYSYAANSLTYPSSPDLSNPLLVQQMSGQVGKKIGMSVGINYTIGNSLKRSRDRRWYDDQL